MLRSRSRSEPKGLEHDKGEIFVATPGGMFVLALPADRMDLLASRIPHPGLQLLHSFDLWTMLHTADITLWLSSSAYLPGNSRMSFRKKYFSEARILNGPIHISILGGSKIMGYLTFWGAGYYFHLNQSHPKSIQCLNFPPFFSCKIIESTMFTKKAHSSLDYFLSKNKGVLFFYFFSLSSGSVPD